MLNEVYVYVYVVITTFEIFLFMFINGYIMQWWSEIRLLIFYDVSSYYGSADTIDNNEKLHDILLIYNHIQTYVFNKYKHGPSLSKNHQIPF